MIRLLATFGISRKVGKGIGQSNRREKMIGFLVGLLFAGVPKPEKTPRLLILPLPLWD